MSSQPMSDEEIAKLSTYEYLVETVAKYEKTLQEKDEKIKELEDRIVILESGA